MAIEIPAPLTPERAALRATVARHLRHLIANPTGMVDLGKIVVGPLCSDLLAGLLGEYDARPTAWWDMRAEVVEVPVLGPVEILFARPGNERAARPMGPVGYIATHLALVLVNCRLSDTQAAYLMELLPRAARPEFALD